MVQSFNLRLSGGALLQCQHKKDKGQFVVVKQYDAWDIDEALCP